MSAKPFSLPVASLLALLLAACNSTSPAPQTVSAPDPSRPRLVSAPGFKLPDGAGCTGAVNRFRALIDNDLETGHTIKSVHSQITAEIDQAASTCAAGNDGAARSQIAASRSKHGYPGG